jgi:hypothetical protein
MDSNTHSTGPSGGLAALTAAVEELAAQDLDGLTDAVRAERVLGVAAAAGPPGRPLAPRAGRRRRPGGGRRRTRPPGRLHRQLAPQPAAHGCRGRPHQRPDRPGPVPRPPDPDGHRPDRRAALPRPRQRPGRRHPGAPRPRHCGGRTGAGGGGPTAGPTPAPPGAGPSAGGDRPRHHHQPGRTPPPAAGAVAGPDPGGHGRPGRPVGTRGRPDPAGRVRTVGPPGQCRR